MALAMLAEIPGLTREQYEAVVQKVNEKRSPPGALFHAGGPVDGGYRVVEVWESREAADAFYNSDVYRQASAAITAQPHIVMTWAIQGVDSGDGWRPVD
jgi:quinol monooxygenase YgiN